MNTQSPTNTQYAKRLKKYFYLFLIFIVSIIILICLTIRETTIKEDIAIGLPIKDKEFSYIAFKDECPTPINKIMLEKANKTGQQAYVYQIVGTEILFGLYNFNIKKYVLSSNC